MSASGRSVFERDSREGLVLRVAIKIAATLPGKRPCVEFFYVCREIGGDARAAAERARHRNSSVKQ